jgi:hypothetical protein
VFGNQETDEDPYATSGSRMVPMMHGCFYGLLFVALAVMYALFQFRGLREPLAMETAQIARHLATGDGFVTDCVRPFDLWYLEARERLPAADAPIPVLWSAPGLPVLQSVLLRWVDPAYAVDVAGGGRIVPAEKQVLIPLGISLFLTTVLLVWLVGHALFDARVAFLSAIAYFVSDIALSGSISGLPVTLSTPVTLLAIWLAVMAIRRSTVVEGGWGVAGLVGLSGVSVALGVLVDYAMVVAIVAIAVLLGVELQRRRWLMLPLFVLVVVLALMPWFARNASTGIGPFGAWPYAALRDTSLFPADSLERSADPVFNVYRSSAAVRQGIANRFIDIVGGVGVARGGIMICLFVLAFFLRSEKSLDRAIKFITLGAVILLVLLPDVPGAVDGWWAFYPLIVVIGMEAFMRTLEREEFFDASMRPLLMTVLVLLCLLPSALRMVQGNRSVYPPYNASIQHFVGGIPSEETALLTDIPWATAWYGGCKSIQIPTRIDDVTALAGMDWDQVGALYLAGLATDDSVWTLIRIGKQVPASVPFKSGVSLPIGREDQLLLTRDDRWQSE